jgi:kinesin family protein 5
MLWQVSEEAESLLRRAAAIHPSSPEPLQALASLKYEQGQQEEARQLLHKSLGLWFKPEGEGGEEDAGNSSSSEDMEEDAAAEDAGEGGG